MIGVIADDATGATDVAAALSRAGLRTALALTTDLDRWRGDADALVLGLKTRSVPAADAVRQSLEAWEALAAQGAERVYLKYCSTFDSTPDGNIGPVTEALAGRLGTRTVVTTPSAPLHGRTVYQGHLFVGDRLLHETHMADHPRTPMRDSSVPRLLRAQARWPVELLPLAVVHSGTGAVRDHLEALGANGAVHVVADALDEADLDVLASAVRTAPVVAGSAGLVGAIGRASSAGSHVPSRPPAGRTAILAGSCSHRTLEQIAVFRDLGRPLYQLTGGPGQSANELADAALRWWDRLADDAPALIASSQPPEHRASAPEGTADLYEEATGLIAAGLAERGLRRLVIAGGETSGAVVSALRTRVAEIGEEAAPGVPWIHDREHGLHLLLKSGNFGGPTLFADVTGDVPGDGTGAGTGAAT